MEILLLAPFFLLFMTITSAQKPHISCEKKYKKVGCYTENRSLQMLFTDRELNVGLNEGHLIDWKKWDAYIHSLACRCNQHAIAKGFDYFTLRYFGLCYGANSVSVYRSGGCLTYSYHNCDDASAKECVGQDQKEYFYEVGRDGGLSDWNVTAPCSKTCGNGTQMRERTCTNPKPSGFGKDCSGLGPVSEVVPCYEGSCKVDGGFSAWSAFGTCSKTCGGGTQTRDRECNNPAPSNGGKDCEGAKVETKSCNSKLCPGREGISKAQEIIQKSLLGFFNQTYPTKTPSGKFHLAIFAIQKAVADEMANGTTYENLQQRLNDLKSFLKVATEGGNIEFARTTLGKSLFVFMKKKIIDGLPYNGIAIATNDFLASIKNDIGDKKFGDLMLMNGGATLIFTMDTTGSMKDEIDAAKSIANAVMTTPRKFPVDYILSPFNDPGFGPVTYKNDSNKNEFITTIESLVVYGGRDCPELSFTGMLEAFKANPMLGSPMFVFTDASAKDGSPENIEKLKTVASQYDCAINFFTNQLGCGDGIQSYKDIASYTSGQIFPLMNHAEIFSFTKYVKTSLKSGVTIAKASFKPTFGRKRQFPTNAYDIFVESGVDVLQVTIEVMARDSARLVVLEDPTSRSVGGGTTSTYTNVFNIDNPAAGKWSLKVPTFVGEYSFVAKVFGDAIIDFAAYFLHQERKDSPVFSIANPLSGPKSTLALQISGIEKVDHNSLRIGVINENGGIIQDGIIPNKMGESAGILQADISTPSGKFKISLSGTTKGQRFRRLSRSGFEATDLVMIGISAGKENTASVNKASTRIQVYVYNSGSSDTFALSASANLGKVDAKTSSIKLDKGHSSTASFDLRPPSNSASLIGKLVKVVVTAVGHSSSKKFQSEVKILWVS